jgi:hypothetical protein
MEAALKKWPSLKKTIETGIEVNLTWKVIIESKVNPVAVA